MAKIYECDRCYEQKREAFTIKVDLPYQFRSDRNNYTMKSYDLCLSCIGRIHDFIKSVNTYIRPKR